MTINFELSVDVYHDIASLFINPYARGLSWTQAENRNNQSLQTVAVGYILYVLFGNAMQNNSLSSAD